MRPSTQESEQIFYRQCAELLGAAHAYRPFPYAKRTRWNNRAPGNGRFPGFGLIRVFGERVHMQLRRPAPINRRFASKAEALNFLAQLVAARRRSAS